MLTDMGAPGEPSSLGGDEIACDILVTRHADRGCTVARDQVTKKYELKDHVRILEYLETINGMGSHTVSDEYG